ncbi:hypothetical protein BDAP_001019 [Binucleata daphniae]
MSNEGQNIYTNVRMYKKIQSVKKDLQVLIDTKQPEFLVSIAYKNLLKNKTQIPLHYLDAQGERKDYVVKLMIENNHEFIYTTDTYINQIYKYTNENAINKQFPGSLAKYTQKFLCDEYFAYFLAWWKYADDFDAVFCEYISNHKIKKVDIELICSIINRIDVFKYTNFLISNDIMCNDLYKHPLYQIKKVVELLETNDVVVKENILKTPFLWMFKDIIETNIVLYDLDTPIIYIKCKEMKHFARTKNIKIGEYDGKNLPEYLLNCCKYFLCDETDSLYIRDILYFFDNLKLNKDWHYYFVKRDKIESFDHFYINYKLFNTYNYDYCFTKQDLLHIDEFLDKVTEHKILHLYFLSAKNPKYKNALSNELERYLENEHINTNHEHTFCYNTDMENQAFSNEHNKHEKQNIEHLHQLDFETKNNTILFLMLNRIGANNFDFYFNTNQLLFLSVLNIQIANNHLEYKVYKNLIEDLYKTLNKNNLSFDEKMLLTKIFELFSHDSEKPCKFFVENMCYVNIKILQNFTVESILDCFSDKSEAIQFMLQVQKEHVFNNDKCKDSHLYYDLIYENKDNCMHDSFISEFSVLLGSFVNYCVEKSACVKTVKHNAVVLQNDINNIDNFFEELLYKNKDIKLLINTFYSNKEIQSKMYLPRAWRIYFTRNKISNFDQLILSKKSTINQIHLLCICAALYTKENKESIYSYVKNVKNTNQDLLFYKFVFLLYALHNKSEECVSIFDDCQKYATTYENKLIASLISYNYTLKTDFEIEEDAKITINKYHSDEEIICNKNKYTELAKMFSTQEDTKKRKTIYEAIRIMDSTGTVSYKDKDKIQTKIYSKLNTNPSFVIQTLTNIDKLENLEWNHLLNYINNDAYTTHIINLIQKHYKHCNFTEIIQALKSNKQYYKHKFLVNMLLEKEIKEKTKSRTFCNIDFFDNLDEFELYDGNTYLGADTYYNTNHYQILGIYAKKCVVNHKLLNQQDLYYCQLKLLEYKYFDKIYWDKWKEIANVDYDYANLLQQDTINVIANNYLKYKDVEIIKLLQKIAGSNRYYLPCFLNTYKNIKALHKIEFFSEFVFLIDV